jgi:hypothetical protein
MSINYIHFIYDIKDILIMNSYGIEHQEKYSKIVIDYKAVMKAKMTGIYCNRLGAVDIGYNPIIIIL